MAHPTISQEEFDSIQNANRRELIEKVKQEERSPGVILQKVRVKSVSLVEALTHLTVCFWYFFFTGLCVLFGRQMPKEWLGFISDYKTKKETKHKVEEQRQEETAKPKKFRVVDIETHRPLVLKRAE